MFGGTGSNLFGQKPATSGGAPAFGAPQPTTPQMPNPSFSTPTTPQQRPGLSFGGTSFQSPTPSTWGQQQNNQPGGFQLQPLTPSSQGQQPVLGGSLGSFTPTASTAAGLTFGTPTATTPSVSQQGLNFGLGSNAPKTTALSFGVQPGLTTTAAAAPAATTSSGFSFGLGTTTAQTSNASTSGGLAFNLGSNAPASTSAPAPAFTTFSTPISSAPSTAPTLGLSLGLGSTTAATSTASTTLSSLPTLSFGPPASSSAPTSSLTAPVTSLSQTPSTPSAGLGGSGSLVVGTPTSKPNPLTTLTAASLTRSETPNHKDTLVPAELMPLIDCFKTFVKEQKRFSSEVNTASLKQITKVTEDADLLKRNVMQLERTLNKNKALNRKLRTDVARGIQDSEAVHRLSVMPRNYPTDNTMAFEYFKNIVDRFQSQAEHLSMELKNMEKLIVCKFNPAPFTPEQLSLTMKRLYESFVALAGRYQSIHSGVTSFTVEVRRKHRDYNWSDSNASTANPSTVMKLL